MLEQTEKEQKVASSEILISALGCGMTLVVFDIVLAYASYITRDFIPYHVRICSACLHSNTTSIRQYCDWIKRAASKSGTARTTAATPHFRYRKYRPQDPLYVQFEHHATARAETTVGQTSAAPTPYMPPVQLHVFPCGQRAYKKRGAEGQTRATTAPVSRCRGATPGSYCRRAAGVLCSVFCFADIHVRQESSARSSPLFTLTRSESWCVEYLKPS